MIKSFRNRETAAFANGERVPAFEGFAAQAERRLAVLDSATSLQDLRALRSHRLEALRGGRLGRYSIRINRQWRICFEWSDTARGPENVEIVDCH